MNTFVGVLILLIVAIIVFSAGFLTFYFTIYQPPPVDVDLPTV